MVQSADKMPADGGVSTNVANMMKTNGKADTYNANTAGRATSDADNNITDLSTDVPSRAAAMREFVLRSGGDAYITRVLIANNGMAAVKGMRSIRKWAYDTLCDDRAVHFTAMAAADDLQAGADFIKMADLVVEVPGGPNRDNYANVELIVRIARQARVDAVWAGWGHASEDPRLPEALSHHGIIFIGPPASAMHALGDKVAATIIAQSVGVPTVAWSGDGLVLAAADADGHVSADQSRARGNAAIVDDLPAAVAIPIAQKLPVAITVPDDLFCRATVKNADSGLAVSARIGYPVMIKASAGGGGKGIRVVHRADEFPAAFLQVAHEVPGSPIFVMKVLHGVRHIEIQLLADKYGDVVTVFARDCSIQRRHQKIIEEAPPSTVPTATIERMEKAAVRLAKSVGYVNCGTVEYLYDESNDAFFFLELNPRLQVEHPCTEMISGVNLPAAQLQVAMGIPLHRIRDVRLLYGMSPSDTTCIDYAFSNGNSALIQRRPMPHGHVTAVRITAENPDHGFQPNIGTIQELNFRGSSAVWGYFSASASTSLHEHGDSQFGHIFAWGQSREQSRRNSVMALKELSIRGDFRTPVEFLIDVLEAPDFIEAAIHTEWLDGAIARRQDRLIRRSSSNDLSTWTTPPGVASSECSNIIIAVLCAAAIKAITSFSSHETAFIEAFRQGIILPSNRLSNVCAIDLQHQDMRYLMEARRVGPSNIVITANKSSVELYVRNLKDNGYLVTIGQRTLHVHASSDALGIQLTADGKSYLMEEACDRNTLVAPTSGKLVRFLCPNGAFVEAGVAYAEMEAMKMVLPLLAASAGHITFCVHPGSIVRGGDCIARLESDGSDTYQATVFKGVLPACGHPMMLNSTDHGNLEHAVRAARAVMENVISGFLPLDLEVALAQFFDAVTMSTSADVHCKALLDHYLAIEEKYDSCSSYHEILTAMREYSARSSDEALLAEVRSHATADERQRVAMIVVQMTLKSQALAAKLELELASILRLRSLHSRRVREEVRRARQHGSDDLRRSIDGAQGAHHVASIVDDARLELSRLTNFHTTLLLSPSDAGRPGVWHARGKKSNADERLFARGTMSCEAMGQALIDAIWTVIDIGLHAIADIQSSHCNVDCNHIFVNCGKTTETIAEDWFADAVRSKLMDTTVATRLVECRLAAIEIKFIDGTTDQRMCCHIKLSQHSPMLVHLYAECVNRGDETDGNVAVLRSTDETWRGDLDGSPANFVYPHRQPIHAVRKRAHLMGTSYVYDFPAVFREALRLTWKENAGARVPSTAFTDFMRCEELVLSPGATELHSVDREPGVNDCGIVAWLMHLATPEYPNGRPLIVIANDITHQMGSFGPREYATYFACTAFARKHGYPRLFISANSGARIGVADEVKDLVRVAWKDVSDPSKGFDYIYLLDMDLDVLRARCKEAQLTVDDVIACDVLMVGGERRHRLTSIFGIRDGIGVENLRGSGLIAGETAEAYRDIFTISLVTCRTVGIGAYVVRLGRRTVQDRGHPIILTGAAALNKVIGREVYGSNLQIGGPQVMHTNGVSQRVVSGDLEGAATVLRWLSFVPCRRDAPLPILPWREGDLPNRDVEVTVDGVDDPRHLLTGVLEQDNDPLNIKRNTSRWLAGLLDRNSFFETMGGWAQSVIVGRGRLGGIPVGVIVAETRNVTRVIPADPATDGCAERTESQAGQVWYPDSAFKTAQAIEDFNRGEQLPLIILATWRGFSGGLRDMHDAVLKYGSMIVDALRDYRQPVLIYIPPRCQLRGGAWVVLDPSINAEYMEMAADEDSRAGILEPAGVVEIKFRRAELLRIMERLDEPYRKLKKEISHGSATRIESQHKLAEREKLLLPLYHQIATQLADLHDTPARMLHKKTVRAVIRWRESRHYLYWRLRRRLDEEFTRKQLALSATHVPLAMVRSTLEDLAKESNTVIVDDRSFCGWFTSTGRSMVESRAAAAKRESLRDEVIELLRRKGMDMDELRAAMAEIHEE